MSKKMIADFLKEKNLVIAGLSRNPKSFSRKLANTLINNGYDVFPVNPKSDVIDGRKCYGNVQDLSEKSENLLILTNKRITDKILMEAIECGYKRIWIQQGSETGQSEAIAKDMNFHDLITKQCLMMFVNPVGIHKFHKFISDFFGLIPD